MARIKKRTPGEFEVGFLQAGGSPPKSMDHNWPLLFVDGIISGKPLQAREAWDHRQLRSLSSILRSALTEATKMAVRGNMHMDTRVRVIEVHDFNSEVKFEI